MNRLPRFLVPLIALALALPAWTNGEPTVKPADVGLSTDRLDRVTETIENDVEMGRIPGAVALIARNGQIAYFDAFGHADREKGVPMKPDTIFRIYSMSKPITGVALMTLFEEGKFKLSDPVAKYLPEFADMKVLVEKEKVKEGPAFNVPDLEEDSAPGPGVDPDSYTTVDAKNPITVQDLLRHTAGFSYGFFGNTSVDKLYVSKGILVTDKDLTDMCRKLGEIPLQYEPGTRWHYSVSVDVQGRLIEVLSGQPFDEFLQERIFEPLGMVDTAFFVPKDKMDRFAQMYAPGGEGGLEVANPLMSRNYVNEPTLHSGGGGLVSTANDYFRFCQMMLNGGELDGKRILSRKTVELMTIDHCGDIEAGREGQGYGFGLGFAVAKNLARIGIPTSVGEYNWGGAAGTGFWIDPAENFIGIYMIQILPPPYPFSSDFKILSYQSIAD